MLQRNYGSEGSSRRARIKINCSPCSSAPCASSR